MEVTYKLTKEKEQIINFLPLTEEEEKKDSQSKFKYAMMKWGKSVKEMYAEVAELKAEASLEFAAEDEKTKCVLTDDKGAFKYTKDGEQKKRDKFKEIEDKKFNVDFYLFTDEERIAQFDPFLVEELRGFFFPSLPTTINEEA